MSSCIVGLPRPTQPQIKPSPGFKDRGIFAYWTSWSNSFFALLLALNVAGAEPAFLGKDSCASSGCHGGAGPNQNQSSVWATQDQHARAPATLTTARSKRLAQILNISDPARDQRCTSCHMPWQNLPPTALPSSTSPLTEAISCETCHGPASNWIRSHTRKDLTRADKLLDGLRDLTALYNRANVCVACHQVVDSQLLEAGHPELHFELDGQSAAMPRHWREKESNTHSTAWLVGQAAALRESTWQITQEKNAGKASERVFQPWQALLWILQQAAPNSEIGRFDTNAISSTEQLRELHSAVNQLAIEAQNRGKTSEPLLISRLPEAIAVFANAPPGSAVHATRAERLVLALDRITLTLPKEIRARTEPILNELFRLVQSRPDFNPKEFGRALATFDAAVREK